MNLSQITVLLSSLISASCLNILGVFPFTGRSHFDVFVPLLEEISRRGHEITVISSFPLEKPLPRYKDVFVPIPPGYDSTLSLQDSALIESRIEKMLIPNRSKDRIKYRCRHLFESNEYQDFLSLDLKFDVIISEYFIFGCHLTPLIDKYRIPFILMQTTKLISWVNQWTGNPDNPSYISLWTQEYASKMSFLERVENTLAWTYSNLYYNYVLDPQERFLFLTYAKRGHVYPDVLYNTSLIFANTHFSLHGARPTVPNVVEIGGVHIKPAKKLPSHLDKWINESTHGVIYFSLGSMIKGHTFPEEKRQMFLRAFTRFPQRVLWKWETDTMPGKPENVMIEKWMPQFDILSHPNVKAYIAHGGLLGVTEAVHCGVPLIIMPQFGDQSTNAKAVETNGGGVILDYRSLDEESIYNALKTALDPSFNKKAKALSARFRDRPMPPLETAIYWVEYVARHGGAPHLRTAAVGMPLYQYLLLDVVAFLAAILSTVMYISFIVTRSIFRRIFKTNKKEKVKKN